MRFIVWGFKILNIFLRAATFFSIYKKKKEKEKRNLLGDDSFLYHFEGSTQKMNARRLQNSV